MKLYYHQCQEPNLGDEINTWFWDKVFDRPAFDDNPQELFVGIGTILNNWLPSAQRLHVFGSGAGYGDYVPDSLQGHWQVHCVRGPLTARQLGLEAHYALSDPAILLPVVHPLAPEKRYPVAFMPHVDIDSPQYRQLIESMGIHYFSPTEDSFALLEKMAATEYLITSAMHGAIIADAYRVPWAPVVTSPEILSFKWQDWLMTMDMAYLPTSLPSYWRYPGGWRATIKKHLKQIAIGRAIRQLIQKRPQFLSEEALLQTRQEQLMDKAQAFKREYLL